MNQISTKIVATIQVIPYNTELNESYKIIEEAIVYLKSLPNIEYRLGVMNTVIGGNFKDVMTAITKLQEDILFKHNNEYIINITLHSSIHNDIDIKEKEQRFVGI